MHNRGATVIDYRFARVSTDTDTDLTVIAVSGEIDAANVDDVSRHTFGLVPDGALIVDLTGIDFIAIEGLCAHSNLTCSRGDAFDVQPWIDHRVAIRRSAGRFQPPIAALHDPEFYAAGWF